MRDLAVTRAKRKELEKGEELMVSVDDLLKKFVKKSARRARKFVQVQKRRIRRGPMRTLMNDWRKESRRLRADHSQVEGSDEEEEEDT